MNYELVAEIVNRAKQGEKGALEELYRITYKRVFFLAYKMFGNESDATDVVQEVYIKVFTRITSLEDPVAFPKWLYTIAINECQQKKREDKKTILLQENDAFLSSLADDDSSVDFVMEKKNLKSFLLYIIDHLPDEQKRAILLYYYENLTIAQIAEIEQVPDGTIKTRLYLARNKLKRAVDIEQKRSGTKLLAFGAPALSMILAEAASMSLMPAELAQKALLGALAAAGFVGGDATFTYIGSNETENTSSFWSKIKTGVLIEVKPVKAVLVGLICISLFIGIGWGTASIFQEKLKVSPVPVNAENWGFYLNRDDLPAVVKDNAKYFSTGFYSQAIEEVTPENAYIRLVGGFLTFGVDETRDLFNMEDTIWCDWFDENTNIVGFFDENYNLIGYIYGYKGSTSLQNEDLRINYDFKIDQKKIEKEVHQQTIKSLEKATEINSSSFYLDYSLPDRIESIRFDPSSAGLSGDQIGYFSNTWTNSCDKEWLNQILYGSVARYWLKNNYFLSEMNYDSKTGILDYRYNGTYYLRQDEQGNILQKKILNVIILYDKNHNVLGYSFVHDNQLKHKIN